MRRTTEEKKAEQAGKTEKMEDSPVEVGEDEDDDDDGDNSGKVKRKEEPMETDELPDLDKPAGRTEKKEEVEVRKESMKKGGLSWGRASQIALLTALVM